MKSSVLRKVSALTLAGTVVFGASACTSVSSSSGKSSGKAAASSAAGGASDKASSASDSAGGGSSSSDSSSSSSDDGGSSGGGLVKGKVGQDVKTDKYTVKVTKVTDNAKSDNQFETPGAGKRFVDITMTVTNNNSSQKITVNEFDIKAHLTDGTSPDPQFVSGVGTELNSDGLYKGDSTTGDVVYPVPQGQKIQYLDIDFNDFSLSGGQTARVELS